MYITLYCSHSRLMRKRRKTQKIIKVININLQWPRKRNNEKLWLYNLISGFPVALLHRYTLYGKDPIRQHLFFIACGLSIGYWNYGNSLKHLNSRRMTREWYTGIRLFIKMIMMVTMILQIVIYFIHWRRYAERIWSWRSSAAPDCPS